MQFRAAKSDLQVAIENFVLVDNVPCPTCETEYALFAPILETEQISVQAQTAWLRDYLATRCPEHPADVITTPDRP